ncbi:MAG: RNA-directed DNA polymerase [Candidatus Gracilibacteria bacterium]|nr:RNA-directed DNA polymerase [Candidatus Gracilibacteria bacterium]MDD2909248.1 RNA-directed DNA polymerase [Candidatus Gracilibacteria bacterium]
MTKEKLIYDLFLAYYEARKNKRNTVNQIAFEYNLEQNIFLLADELFTGKYELGRSVYFIQNHPVKREVFASGFRDRIVHHLIYDYIYPIFDRSFIYDSYSCRVGKGTSFGIKRINSFIRACSDNYTQDCYILKLDIQGYFMSLDKNILFKQIEQKLFKHKENMEYDFTIALIKKVIFHDYTFNALFKGQREDYIGLPKSKSLFYSDVECGLPIGNLTSQLFSNIYLDDFDKYIKTELKCEYYGRYVDDFIIIHKDKEYLTQIIIKIREYLDNNLNLILHPKKIYLQNYKKGVLFLGAFIKPYRNYIRKRTIGYFFGKIKILNHRFKNQNYKMDYGLANDFSSIINSYLGMMKNYSSYKIRKKVLLSGIDANFWNHFYISSNFKKIKSKNGHIGKLAGLQNQLGLTYYNV